MSQHVIDFSNGFTGRMHEFSPAGTGAPVWSAFVTQTEASLLARRLHDEIQAGALPFLEMSFAEELEQRLAGVLESLPSARHLVLLGIGGSALGPKALQKAFAPGQDRPGHAGPWLWVADNIDAATLEAWMGSLDASETIVAVVSKSGSTIETMAQYFLVKPWLQEHLGSDWSKHVVIITDPVQGPLRAEAEACHMASLPVPPALGGRYSIVSAVGMFPAAFMGMDWQAFLSGARKSVENIASPRLADDPSLLLDHPAFALAAWAAGLMRQGYDQLIFFNYIPLWKHVGEWFAQLWAESLGKNGKGSMPLSAVGATDQHSLQQMFLDGKKNNGCLFIDAPNLDAGRVFDASVPDRWAYLRGQRFGSILHAEAVGTCMALVHHNVPLTNMVLESTDEEACGKLMGLLMATTLLTGWLLDLNPLDQPAVEFGKRVANARLGAPGYETEKQLLADFSRNTAPVRTCSF